MFYSKEHRIEIFAQAIVTGKNQSDSYRLAYPASEKWKKNTVNVKASQFAKEDKVLIRVNQLRSEASKQLKVKFNKTLNDTLVELMNIGWFDHKDLCTEDGTMKDIKDIPEHVMRALAQVDYGQMNKVDETGQVVGNITYISKYSVNKIQALNKILEYQLAEHDKPPEDDEKEEIDPIQLARRVISLIYAAKQKLDKDKHGDITHSRGNQTSANDR